MEFCIYIYSYIIIQNKHYIEFVQFVLGKMRRQFTRKHKSKNCKHNPQYGGGNISKLREIVAKLLIQLCLKIFSNNNIKTPPTVNNNNVVLVINKFFNQTSLCFQKLPTDILNDTQLTKLDNILASFVATYTEADNSQRMIEVQHILQKYLYFNVPDEIDIDDENVMYFFHDIYFSGHTEDELVTLYPHLELSESEELDVYKNIQKRHDNEKRILQADISTLNAEDLQLRQQLTALGIRY